MPVTGVISYETVDVTETASGLTAATAAGCVPQAAEGRVEEGPIRYCVDGTTATEDVGRIANVGELVELKNRGEVALFSAIRADAAEGDGRVSFALGVDWQS
jgi:hypothetical protein